MGIRTSAHIPPGRQGNLIVDPKERDRKRLSIKSSLLIVPGGIDRVNLNHQGSYILYIEYN